MATYAFYPIRKEQRRTDGLNFAIAVGASVSAARTAAEALLGELGALAGWASADLASAPAAFVAGLPVGSRSQAVWPSLDRGGSPLKGG